MRFLDAIRIVLTAASIVLAFGAAAAGPPPSQGTLRTVLVNRGATDGLRPQDVHSHAAAFNERTYVFTLYSYWEATCAPVKMGYFDLKPKYGVLETEYIEDYTIPAPDYCAGSVVHALDLYYTWTYDGDTEGTDRYDGLYVSGEEDGAGSFFLTVYSNLIANPNIAILSPSSLFEDQPEFLPLQAVVAASRSNTSARAHSIAADGAATAIALLRSEAPVAGRLKIRAPFSLARYSANFPATAPAGGAARELVIAPGDFIAVGDRYYAAALVEGPADQIARPQGSGSPVTFAQAGLAPRVHLTLVQPPVLLLHGLWGDETSLTSTYDFLGAAAPWKYNPTNPADGLRTGLLRGSYVANKAFDSLTNQLKMRSAVERLLEEQKSLGIVGGRIDVVAHSMGGLVSRAFTKSASYAGPRNRGLGTIRQIVTLDTPHEGSELARYLIANRNSRPIAGGTFFWKALCGASARTSVQTCFRENGMDVTGGAVASLIPASPNLTKAPPLSAVANLQWTAVVSTAGKTVLRSVLDGVIAGIDATAGTGTDAILGRRPNDVIVTQDSQRAGALRVATFKGLAHSQLPVAGFKFGRSVTDDARVNRLVACVLRTPGRAACLPAGAASPVAAAGEGAPLSLVRGPTASLPATVVLGRTTPVSLAAGNGEIVRVLVHQAAAGRPLHSAEAAFARAGRRLRVDVVPAVVGRSTFTIGVVYRDGTVQTHDARTFVRFDPAAVSSFVPDRIAAALVLFAGEDHDLRALGRLTLDGREVDVTAATRYTVLRDPGGAVALDGNTVSAARPGRAVIRATLGGRVRDLEVIVRMP